MGSDDHGDPNEYSAVCSEGCMLTPVKEEVGESIWELRATKIKTRANAVQGQLNDLAWFQIALAIWSPTQEHLKNPIDWVTRKSAGL